MNERASLFASLPHDDRGRLAFVRDLWERGALTDKAPALEVAVSTLLGVAERQTLTVADWLDALDERFAAEETQGWRTPANRTEREYAARQARMAVEELRLKVAEFDAAVRCD